MNCPQVSHLRQMSGDAVDSWGSFRQWNLLQPSTRFDRPHQKSGKQWQTLVHSWTNGPKVCKRRVQYNDKIFQSWPWRRVAPHYCILGLLGIPEPSAFGYKSSWMVFQSLLPWSCECAFWNVFVAFHYTLIVQIDSKISLLDQGVCHVGCYLRFSMILWCPVFPKRHPQDTRSKLILVSPVL